MSPSLSIFLKCSNSGLSHAVWDCNQLSQLVESSNIVITEKLMSKIMEPGMLTPP